MKPQQLDSLFSDVRTGEYRTRFFELQKALKSQYTIREKTHWFSASGRTEICGNHTDHNQGKVLASAIQLDTIGAAFPTPDAIVEIHSRGFGSIRVDLAHLDPTESEKETSEALIRGIAAYLDIKGINFGGFRAAVSSQVLSGSGLSSSASFEALIGSIFNTFYNQGRLSPLTLALAGQYAENIHFGKPCGLMDQLACTHGGILEIDFKNPQNPQIKPIHFTFEDHHYSIVIVDTGQGHEGLTGEYAAIPGEMKEIAGFFGCQSLREVKPDHFYKSMGELKNRYSHRAVLRASHYFSENERVSQLSSFLVKTDIPQSLKIIRESGNSSFKFLQNIYPPDSAAVQPLSLALALGDHFLKERGRGVCRVHGGGFAGTIQVFVHREDRSDLIKLMEDLFTPGCCTIIKIRNNGLLVLNGE